MDTKGFTDDGQNEWMFQSSYNFVGFHEPVYFFYPELVKSPL